MIEPYKQHSEHTLKRRVDTNVDYDIMNLILNIHDIWKKKLDKKLSEKFQLHIL